MSSIGKSWYHTTIQYKAKVIIMKKIKFDRHGYTKEGYSEQDYMEFLKQPVNPEIFIEELFDFEKLKASVENLDAEFIRYMQTKDQKQVENNEEN